MKTVSFRGSCEARSELTLASGRIGGPFRLVGSRLKFANGCNNLMRVQLFLASDGDEPSSGEPSGASVLADYGQVAYIVGNAEAVDLRHDVLVSSGPSWVKVYADNRDFYAHDVVCQLTIEPLRREGGQS